MNKLSGSKENRKQQPLMKKWPLNSKCTSVKNQDDYRTGKVWTTHPNPHTWRLQNNGIQRKLVFRSNVWRWSRKSFQNEDQEKTCIFPCQTPAFKEAFTTKLPKIVDLSNIYFLQGVFPAVPNTIVLLGSGRMAQPASRGSLPRPQNFITVVKRDSDAVSKKL